MLNKNELVTARHQSLEELDREIGKRCRRLYSLREKKVVEELENPHEIRLLRRGIAQLKTIRAEKK
ncbi:MAG: 50S ribosomal protein L29 [Planctomycetota bacterium]|jgi:ribosomal protein L29|nr:50S ribosomal protein L29 [Planctomycetota bacterium]